MVLIQGKGVSKGVVRGPLYFFQRPNYDIPKTKVADLAAEKARVVEAREKSSAQLYALADKCREEAGEESAVLFETHAMFCDDDDYVEAIETMLNDESCNAEYAVKEAGEQFAAMFAAMDDAYMRARSADVKDVTQRILNNLMGIAEGGIDSEEPVILCADDLAPSETLQLDKTKILGFALTAGSSNGHTAILARTMGIPAICSLGAELKEALQGRMAYLDGETGKVVLDPDNLTIQTFKDKMEKQRKFKELMAEMKGKEDVTLDGRHINVYCNIGNPDDVTAVKNNDGQGIGLFRSEFLYLAETDYPSEEKQFQAYKKVAAAMDGKRV
ncbi:MAG: phosphoenolpyruvate--protein phosphotransferase, partial [Oscillibacter sp.]|nr:phosphoenolpyruvate--protein phosphotransferase [Oscillibacter sp.]